MKVKVKAVTNKDDMTNTKSINKVKKADISLYKKSTSKIAVNKPRRSKFC